MSSRYIREKPKEPRRCFFCHVVLPEEPKNPYFCNKEHTFMWAMQEAARIDNKYHGGEYAKAASA
jgi:hypothetical protein